MHILSRTLLMVALLLATPRFVVAGCASDCRDDFDSEVQSCNVSWDDPDEADDLSSCIDDAHSGYEDCIEECQS